MPIHLPQFQPKIPIGGLIKNGVLVTKMDPRTNTPVIDPKTNKPVTYPKQLDHWLVMLPSKNEGDDSYEVDTRIMDKVPKDKDGKCRRLPIILSSDDIERIARTGLAGYMGAARACTGDGRQATRWDIVDGVKSGEPRQIKCPCDWYENPTQARSCDGELDFRCSIELPERITIGSLHRYYTQSVIGITEMLGSLAMVQQMIGTLVGARLWLCLKQVTVRPKGMRKKKVWTAYVEGRGDNLQDLRGHVLSQAKEIHDVAKISGRVIQVALPPAAEPEVTDADIAAEFHPNATPASELEQKASPEQSRAVKMMLSELAALIYPERAASEEEKAKRREEIWGRVNHGLRYRYADLTVRQVATLLEIGDKHLRLERAIVELAKLEISQSQPEPAPRDVVWRTYVVAGADESRLSSDQLDDVLERIEMFFSRIRGKSESASNDEWSDDPSDDDDDEPPDFDGEDDDDNGQSPTLEARFFAAVESDRSSLFGDAWLDELTDLALSNHARWEAIVQQLDANDFSATLRRRVAERVAKIRSYEGTNTPAQTETKTTPPEPSATSASPAPADPPAPNPDDPLPKNHPLLDKVSAALARLAELRGIDMTNTQLVAKSKKEILAASTVAVCKGSVPLAKLTESQATAVLASLEDMIRTREKEEAEDAPDPEPTPASSEETDGEPPRDTQTRELFK